MKLTLRNTSFVPRLLWCLGPLILAGMVAGCGGGDAGSRADEYLKKGNYPAAIIELKTVIQDKPDSVPARLKLAEALERLHDLDGTEQQLRKALEHGGKAEDLVPRIALLMLDRNDTQKLIAEFRDRRLENPDADATLRGVLALAYLGAKRTDQGRETLTGLRDVASVQTAKAQLLVGEGKAKEALSLLDQVRVDGSRPWWVSRAAGRIASASGDRARAIEFLKAANDAAPWHLGVLGEFGEVLVGAGEFKKAGEIRDRLKKVRPNYFWTHYIDALVLSSEGKTAESHAAAIRVLNMSPEHAPSVLMAASAELAKGDVLMADRRLQAFVTRQPQSLSGLRMLADSRRRAGKLAESSEILRKGLALAPNDPVLLSIQADIQISQQQYPQAAQTLQRLLSAKPSDFDAALKLAEVRSAQKNAKGADELLGQVMAQTKDNPALQARLIATALKIGRIDTARRIADEGLKSKPEDVTTQLNHAAVQSAAKDYDGAWKTTTSLLDKKPDLPLALGALSRMARSKPQKEELLGRYQKAIKANPASAQLYYDHYNLLKSLDAKAPDRIATLEAGLKAVPEAIALRTALVQEQVQTGQVENALAVAQTGVAMSSATAQAKELLAEVYEKAGKNEQASETYRSLVRENPQNAEWALRLARLDRSNNRTREAESLMRKMIEERPFDVRPYLLLADMLAVSNPGEALSVARQMGTQPELATKAVLLEGDVLLASGKPQEAMAKFVVAAKSDASPVPLLRMVAVYDKQGNEKAADQEMAGLLRRFPQDNEVVQRAVQRAMKAENWSTVIDTLSGKTALLRENPYALNDLAWSQVMLGKPEALVNARRASEMLAGHPNALDTLGMALAGAGQRAEALTTLRQAVAKAPKVPAFKVHLASVLKEAGDAKAAREQLTDINPKELSKSDLALLTKLKAGLGMS